MRKIVTFMIISLFVISSVVAAKPRDEKLDAQANEIVKELKLNSNMQNDIYNILLHVKKRTEDIPLGSPKYKQLIEYVNQERLDMMNVLLQSPKKFKEYRTKYDPIADQEMKKMIEKSQNYIRNNGEEKEDAPDSDILNSGSEENSGSNETE